MSYALNLASFQVWLSGGSVFFDGLPPRLLYFFGAGGMDRAIRIDSNSSYELSCWYGMTTWCHQSADPLNALPVFIDQELDLDYEFAGAVELAFKNRARNELMGEITSGIAAIEPIAHNWPDDLKLQAKRSMGEAMVELSAIAQPNVQIFYEDFPI